MSLLPRAARPGERAKKNFLCLLRSRWRADHSSRPAPWLHGRAGGGRRGRPLLPTRLLLLVAARPPHCLAAKKMHDRPLIAGGWLGGATVPRPLLAPVSSLLLRSQLPYHALRGALLIGGRQKYQPPRSTPGVVTVVEVLRSNNVILTTAYHHTSRSG